MLPLRDLLGANPVLGDAAAAEVLAGWYGLTGRLRDLGSLQDQNFSVVTADEQRFVLKVARPGETRAALELQNAAMRHVLGRVRSDELDFDSPQVVTARDGSDVVERDGHLIRLLSWVEGTPLAMSARLTRRDLTDLGALAGRTALALADFTHPAMDRDLQWDARRAETVVDELLPQIVDDRHRELVRRAVAAHRRAAALDAGLPRQVVHADITDVNAVRQTDAAGVTRLRGVLDFGDVMNTWRVADAAATASGVTGHEGVDDVLDAVVAALAGYVSVCPLVDAELEAFWPLVLARSAIDLVVSDIQYQLNPSSEYNRLSAAVATRSLSRLSAVPDALAHAAVLVAAGRPVPGPRATAPIRSTGTGRPIELVAGLADAPVLDLSVTSDDFAYGEWADPAALERLMTAAPVSIGRWGESRMTVAPEPAELAPANLRLGVDVFAAPGTPVRAPWAATVVSVGPDEVLLELGDEVSGDAVTVRLDGLEPAVRPGGQVLAGDALGTVVGTATGPGCLGLQLVPDAAIPRYGHGRHRTAWLAICPDPSALLGRDVAAAQPQRPAVLLEQRAAHVAPSQHLYYDEPVEIVRGWKHRLYDSDARPYLDMINNIASVGHTHPAVTRAATRQLRRLNTNSRFLYDSMSRYARRIAELLPPELGSVFLVNSGSEAADLAVQLARVTPAAGT